MQPMKDRDTHQSFAGSLARMMALGPDSSTLWSTEELGEILRHQLASPLEFDILGMDQTLVKELRARWAADPPIETFGDLFCHPHPPLEFLDLAKQFAKASRAHRDGPLPEEVAVILHLLSIVAALTKCGRRITRLNDQGLRFGLNWALEQAWLDQASRKLLQSGLDALGSEPETETAQGQ
jgi:hypothetical protein